MGPSRRCRGRVVAGLAHAAVPCRPGRAVPQPRAPPYPRCPGRVVAGFAHRRPGAAWDEPSPASGAAVL